MKPPNFRRVDNENPDLDMRESEEKNCRECYYYEENGREELCKKFGYVIAKITYIKRVQGYLHTDYAGVHLTAPVTEKVKMETTNLYICDYFLPTKVKLEGKEVNLKSDDDFDCMCCCGCCSVCCLGTLLLYLFSVYPVLFPITICIGLGIAFVAIIANIEERKKKKKDGAVEQKPGKSEKIKMFIKKHEENTERLLEKTIRVDIRHLSNLLHRSVSSVKEALKSIDNIPFYESEGILSLKRRHIMELLRRLAAILHVSSEIRLSRAFLGIIDAARQYPDSYNKISEKYTICPDCGSENPVDARYCSYCGVRLK